MEAWSCAVCAGSIVLRKGLVREMLFEAASDEENAPSQAPAGQVAKPDGLSASQATNLSGRVYTQAETPRARAAQAGQTAAPDGRSAGPGTATPGGLSTGQAPKRDCVSGLPPLSTLPSGTTRAMTPGTHVLAGSRDNDATPVYGPASGPSNLLAQLFGPVADHEPDNPAGMVVEGGVAAGNDNNDNKMHGGMHGVAGVQGDTEALGVRDTAGAGPCSDTQLGTAQPAAEADTKNIPCPPHATEPQPAHSLRPRTAPRLTQNPNLFRQGAELPARAAAAAAADAPAAPAAAVQAAQRRTMHGWGTPHDQTALIASKAAATAAAGAAAVVDLSPAALVAAVLSPSSSGNGPLALAVPAPAVLLTQPATAAAAAPGGDTPAVGLAAAAATSQVFAAFARLPAAPAAATSAAIAAAAAQLRSSTAKQPGAAAAAAQPQPSNPYQATALALAALTPAQLTMLQASLARMAVGAQPGSTASVQGPGKAGGAGAATRPMPLVLPLSSLQPARSVSSHAYCHIYFYLQPALFSSCVPCVCECTQFPAACKVSTKPRILPHIL